MRRSLPNSALRFNVGSVRARLPDRQIDWFDSIDSTMIEARRDLQPGRIVGAEEQTAGMGRHGRKWISEPGAGLYVSMVLAAWVARFSRRIRPIYPFAMALTSRLLPTATYPRISPDVGFASARRFTS